MNANRVVILIVACASLSLLAGLAAHAKLQSNQKPHQKLDQALEQDEPIKSEARKQFMRSKLTSNQQIVEGLSLKDFALIRDGAQGVTALVKGQHWFVLDTPEYKDYSKNMEQASQRLVDAANDKNIEAAALRYFDLTLNCIDCHQYLETMRN